MAEEVDLRSQSSEAEISYDELAHDIGLSVQLLRKYLAEPYWDKPIPDLTTAPVEQLNTHMIRYLLEYKHIKFHGKTFQEAYGEDFEGWTEFHFKQVNRTLCREMLNILGIKGIEPHKEGNQTTIAKQLALVAQGQSTICTPMYPFGRSIIQSEQDPNIQQFIQNRPQVPTPLAYQIPAEEAETSSQQEVVVRPDNRQETPVQEDNRQGTYLGVHGPHVRPSIENNQGRQTFEKHTMSPTPLQTGHRPNFQPVHEYPVPHNPPTTPAPPSHYRTTPNLVTNPYDDLPPTRFVRNGMIPPEKYVTFQKTWKKERNYTGKPYDLLYDKTRLFIDVCRRLGITEDQYYAVFPCILEGRAEDFFIYNIGPGKTWKEIYNAMDVHFDTNTNHSQYWADWTTITFRRMKEENPDKTPYEALELMIDKLSKAQRALGADYQGEIHLSTTVVRACRGVPELATALVFQKPTCEAFFADLRACLRVSEDNKATNTYFTDRRYNNFGRVKNQQARFHPKSNFPDRAKKKCFVCQREGCWSTKHTPQERHRAKNQYFNSCDMINNKIPTPDEFSQYLTEFEGYPESDEDELEMDDEVAEKSTQFLMDNAYLHRTTGEDIWKCDTETPSNQFTLSDPYRTEYQGELWDTGASNYSTVGKNQLEAYLRLNPHTKVDWSPGSAHIRFGGSPATTALGTVRIKNALGTTTYHILDTPTPFLFSLKDADRVRAYFDNTKDIIVRNDGETIPVVRKWGHPFFNTSPREAGIFFTETELRRLHRRFGHPHTERLHKMLTRAGHDVDQSILNEIKKFCHHCQTHDQSPRRFKFTIKDDCNFNYEVVVDAVRIDRKQILHVIDTATSFQAATFLRTMSAKDAWEALCKCWINVYQGPPDFIVHDPGTNFASEEFRNHAKIMGITCREMPVEAHWALGKVERAHGPLRRTYDILKAELGHHTEDEAILQMAVKALNDTAGPDGLVPTLLVFGAYPRINQDSPPSPDIIRRAEAIKKAMRMLRDERAKVEINRAINHRNGPSSYGVLSLPLRSEVLAWREKQGWDGPYEIQSIEGTNIIVDMPNGPAQFRCTQIKPYYRAAETEDNKKEAEDIDDVQVPAAEPVMRRKRGRPRKAAQYFTFTSIMQTGIVFLSQKEKQDFTLAIKLRNDGVINTPGLPFEESDATEISDLAARGVFEFLKYDPDEHGDIRIFKSRLVREVKGKTTKPYEKSRLVVQGYNDTEKETVLTQSPTIQRMSQRLLLALGPTLIRDYNAKGELRDITQAYTQSVDMLARAIFVRLPIELKSKYPEGTILRVVRPLYGVPESGLYWFKTYHKHHREKLGMIVSTYDPCLLVTDSKPEDFGITGLQTDDTFSFATPAFSAKEEAELRTAGFRAKPKQALDEDSPIEFNGTRIQLADGSITLTQKGQAEKLAEIDPRAKDYAQQYVSQRARGAYISSICQPEAAYDLSTAAQIVEPQKADVEALNKRIEWQMENCDRGLTYIPLDLSHTKLFIFTDGSFANNSDMTSQLGLLIVLATENHTNIATTPEFEISGNIVHWNSSKCKRVTRSVLASELYGMVNGFDSAIALRTTLHKIMKTLDLPQIPAILCSDSKSLYDCLVKLGTTQEKRLMIDIMSLRESYERREISEVRWINGKDNPADAFTKKAPNQALETLISTNKLRIRVEAFVERTE